MHFMRLRHYHPELRRFIEPDPIGYAGGLNLYAYVGNNPVNYADPWGLKIYQVWRPLQGLAFGLGYHTAIRVNDEIFGFGAKSGVVKEQTESYGWGMHEVEIRSDDRFDEPMLEYLKKAADKKDHRFLKETYGLLTNNCMSFAACAIEEVLGNSDSRQEVKYQ